MGTDKDLQAKINSIYAQADKYESEAGHGMTDIERDAWIGDISSAMTFAEGNKVLDVGCGTGVLSRILLESGGELVGLDASKPMVEEAQ
ncbi:MAG: methyltransferase domain-containing protein, partial [Anaerolineae bacterium]|nr:methyltransferase domain-containing protein [Anaerolineae bacterium]